MTIDNRFWEFHYRNLHVYETLVRLGRQAVAAGYTRIGIELLYAVARWELMMETTGEQGFKLNDHFTSRYARLIMEQEPDLAGLFETRMLRAA